MRITEILVEFAPSNAAPAEKPKAGEIPASKSLVPGEELVKKDVPQSVQLLNKTMDDMGITDPYARNAILGKAHGEAGNRLRSTEISYANTDNDRIRTFIPQLAHLKDDELNALKKDDRAFFNRAYGGALNNTDPDDGYKFRGRGLTGITGKSNYQAVDDALGLKGELVKNPDLLLDPDIDRRAAVWYYKNAGIANQKFENQGQANSWAIYKAGGKAYAPGTELHMIALKNMSDYQGGKFDPTQLASIASSAVRKTDKRAGGGTIGAASAAAGSVAMASRHTGDVTNTRDDEDDFQTRLKKLLAKKKRLAQQRAVA